MSQIFKEKERERIPVSLIKVDNKDDLNFLKEGEFVDVVGITKGHGFQGTVKRHGFSGGPKTHGQKNRQRAPGSIGSTALQRVVPGKKMAGHMGCIRKTIKNLKIVAINNKEGILLVKGSVPGANKSKVTVKKI